VTASVLPEKELPVTLTSHWWQRFAGPQNGGVAVGISLLSCIQAEIFVIAYVRLMAAIFDLLVTVTLESIRISYSVLLDPENVVVAIGISLLSCLEAEIFVFAYVLPVMVAIFDFLGHYSIEEYSLWFQRVAGSQKWCNLSEV